MSRLRGLLRRFRAGWAAARPVRTPASGPGGTRGGGARHTSLLVAPDGTASDDAASAQTLNDLRGRFADLLRRLEADARRDGMYNDGPMTRVMELLQLCMGILCQVTDQNIRTTERHAGQVVGAIESAKRGSEAAVEWARLDLARQMAGEQDRFADRIAERVVDKADRAIGRRARQFPLKAALWLVVALVGSNVATGLYMWGQTGKEVRAAQATARDATVAGMMAVYREAREGLYQAFHAEGAAGGLRWMQLMQWNTILTALDQCTSNNSLTFTGANGRLACRVPLWIEPPVSQAPAPSNLEVELDTTPAPQPVPQPVQKPARKPSRTGR